MLILKELFLTTAYSDEILDDVTVMLKIFDFSYTHERTSNSKINVLRLRSSTFYPIYAESKVLGYTFALSKFTVVTAILSKCLL